MSRNIKKLKSWLAIGFVLSCSRALASEPQTLSELLENARAEKGMPGLRAAIRYPDGRIVRAAVGLGDREAGTPLDNTVGMPGGSTGKTFVAAVTMLLVEDGTLSLDDRASKWLGDTDWYAQLPNAEHIQVRHLLSHSSGIPDYPGTSGFRRAMIWRAIRHGSAKFDPEELIGYSLAKEPTFPVGQGYHYSDTGYLVLGRVIEAASGRSYYDLLKKRILHPQKLDGIRPQNKSVLTNIVPGYVSGARNLKKDGRMKFDPSSEWTGGGLVTTPTMLVKFFGALAEGRVVKPETLALMLKGEWQNPMEPSWRYGYGLFIYDDGKCFGHAGLWSGYRTDVRHYAASGLTVAVQTNRDGRMELENLLARLAAAAGELE
ncbi:MAG: beta-lactamase family protein [Phycisphaerales bacterium]|nr:beta-lactamase family protein [Phycisphaerales bacterium]